MNTYNEPSTVLHITVMKQWELLSQVPKNNASQINSCAVVEKGGPWSSESEKVNTVVGGGVFLT